MDNKQARENIKSLLQGKAPRRELSLVEAKARLRATDPAIDISRPLGHLSQGDMKKAGITLAVETAAAVTIPYLRPLLTLGVTELMTGSKKQLRS